MDTHPHSKSSVPLPPSNAEAAMDSLATPTVRGREEPGQKDLTGYQAPAEEDDTDE